MRYLLIEGGVVVNAIKVNDPAEFPQWTLVQSDAGRIGDLWDGQTFTTPAPVVVVPQSVTRRQAKQALRLSGKLGLVQFAIDAIADPLQRGLMQDEWDESLTFERNRQSLVAMATAIGLDSAQIDELFITAATLS